MSTIALGADPCPTGPTTRLTDLGHRPDERARRLRQLEPRLRQARPEVLRRLG